ncbi:MAG: hypothetical protein Q9219_005302 [cf. Caloplaca sp. 3 TL-2023]
MPPTTTDNEQSESTQANDLVVVDGTRISKPPKPLPCQSILSAMIKSNQQATQVQQPNSVAVVSPWDRPMWYAILWEWLDKTTPINTYRGVNANASRLTLRHFVMDNQPSGSIQDDLRRFRQTLKPLNKDLSLGYVYDNGYKAI